MDVPPRYEANEEAAAAAAWSQQAWSTERRPTSEQSQPTTTIKPSDKPFRVALIMSRNSETYIDSKGALQPSKVLKVKCGSIMVRRDTTEVELRRLMWECVYDTFKLRGWKCAPRTDAELASGKVYATGDEWKAMLARLVEEKDAGQDPVLRLSFSWKKGKRVKLETESELCYDRHGAPAVHFGRRVACYEMWFEGSLESHTVRSMTPSIPFSASCVQMFVLDVSWGK